MAVPHACLPERVDTLSRRFLNTTVALVHRCDPALISGDLEQTTEPSIILPPRRGENGFDSGVWSVRARPGHFVAIVFIHGYSGALTRTWGNFPTFIQADHRLDAWDLFSVGVTTSLLPDLIDCLVLYGTPSDGLRWAGPFKFWNRQVRDLSADSDFMRDLRQRRNALFDDPPFTFATVAGDTDDFVPGASSLDPFERRFHHVVPGNHLGIVKPTSRSDVAVRVAISSIVGEGASAGPWSEARMAIERGEFREAARRLEPHADELDPHALVQLALALEELGRRDKALATARTTQRQAHRRHGCSRRPAQASLAARAPAAGRDQGKKRSMPMPIAKPLRLAITRRPSTWRSTSRS